MRNECVLMGAAGGTQLNLRLGFLGRRTYRDQSLKGITAGNEKSRPLDLVGRRSRGESWSDGK